METSEEATAIATAFVTARRAATPLAGFPGRVPASFREAYAIQECAISLWPDAIGGWKVAGVSPDFRSRYGAQRLAGPAFAADIRRAGGDGPTGFPVFTGGFAAVEAEFIIKVGDDLEPADADDLDRLAAKIASLHAGVETAGSPFAAINEFGPASVVSDFGNNAGLILGPAIENWRDRPWDNLTARASVNGVLVGEGDASRVAGGPLAALAFLVTQLAERGRRLGAGDIISTGMTTGIHPVVAGDAVLIEFGGGAAIRAIAEPAQPRQ